MLIQKNVKTSFLLNAGRNRSSVNGWTASYQLLDKTGAVIFPVGGGYTVQDLQEIGNGLYGVAIIFSLTYCGFMRWKISDGVTDLYSAEPYTILSSYGNKNVEQTILANFGASRTGKNIEFRVLNDDLTEEETWSSIGVFELGHGMYGAVTSINKSFTGYIEWKNITDGLYVSDPVLFFESLNAPIIQAGKTTVSVANPDFSISVSPLRIEATVPGVPDISIMKSGIVEVRTKAPLNVVVSV